VVVGPAERAGECSSSGIPTMWTWFGIRHQPRMRKSWRAACCRSSVM
jgi:hypothetical protein